MGFLNSLLLWGGLAAAGIAVPIIIHLLYRKHRKQTDWAAMELLRRALVIRSGQVKLEDLLILFLRCLALALVAFALLRPILKTGSVQWLGEQRVGMVVAVDASYSMNHGRFTKRYEQAAKRARQITCDEEERQLGPPVRRPRDQNRLQRQARRGGDGQKGMVPPGACAFPNHPGGHRLRVCGGLHHLRSRRRESLYFQRGNLAREKRLG